MIDIESCMNIDNIDFPPNLAKMLKDNKALILREWMIYPTLLEVLKNLDISKEDYEQNIALPVIEYVIGLIEGINSPGDCPGMKKLINLFCEKGFSVEDVYLSCSAFKNLLYSKLLENKIEQSILSNLIMILDLKLSNIIAVYTKRYEKKEEILTLQNNMMKEHLLLTVTNKQGIITYAADAFCELCGYSKNELLNKTHRIINDPEQDKKLFKNMWKSILDGNKWSGKFRNIKKDGEFFVLKTTILPIKDEEGNIIEFMAIRDNITDREVFQYDQLTNVYTRRIFEDKFETLIKDTKEDDKAFSVIIADIDNFKKLQDTYGQEKGDEILAEFTKVIQKNIRLNDMCFRWGEKEFILLLPMANLTIAYNVAQRIRVDFNRDIIIDDEAQSCSFGVTEFREDDTKDSILKRADEALYNAKKSGRNRVVVD